MKKIIIILFLSLFCFSFSSSTFAATTKKGIQSSKTGHHTIQVIHKVIKPKAIKYKPYKAPKQHITKVKTYHIKHVSIKHYKPIHTKIHYPKVKTIHITASHKISSSSFHTPKIHIVTTRHRSKL